MFDVKEWLEELLESGQPRHERLSFLVTANRGLEVSSWGFLSHYRGHQSGLEQEEALELLQYSAFLEGLACAGVEIYAPFKSYFDKYQEEHLTAPEESQAPSL